MKSKAGTGVLLVAAVQSVGWFSLPCVQAAPPPKVVPVAPPAVLPVAPANPGAPAAANPAPEEPLKVLPSKPTPGTRPKQGTPPAKAPGTPADPARPGLGEGSPRLEVPGRLEVPTPGASGTPSAPQTGLQTTPQAGPQTGPAGGAGPGAASATSPANTANAANAAANAEQMQLGLADALYSRQQWDAAIPEYQKFLNDFPRSADLPAAYYRLAECYLKIGNTNSARLYWGKLVALPQPGPIGGGASYKLAEYEFKERAYGEAAAHFKLASQLLPELRAKQSAQYFAARSYQELGRSLEARGLYQMLADAPEKHPFRESSQFQLGLLLKEANRNAEALSRFEKLGAEAESAEIRAESTARSALLLLELNEPAKALKALEKALALKEVGQWRKVLQLGVFKAHVALGNPEQIVASFGAVSGSVEPAQLSELQMLVANAHKTLKQHGEAAEMYAKVIEAAPDSAAAALARYERLVCLYNLERPELPQEIDAFLAGRPKAAERDNALLMKAELFRLKSDFTVAGAAYAQVVKSKELKPERRRDALMRWAECSVRTGDAESTVAATGELLSVAPDYPLAATALFWRAESLRRLKKYGEAEKAYETLSKRFPNSSDRETALKQWALLRGEQNDDQGMAQRFEQLLKEYPESASAPEAHHWIGRASFEAKDYKKAVPHLEEARKRNADYFESDSLRLVYCAYNLGDPDAFWNRVQEYLPRGKTKISQDLLRWCAQWHIDAKAHGKAEPVLTLLCAGEEVQENDWFLLASARQISGKHGAAIEAVEAYLKLVTHPASKARGLLVKARAELGGDKPVNAQKTVEEALRLQPEGLLNGQARLLSGDIQASRKEWEAAAKTYESISIAFDEEEIVPVALEKAYRAYREAGKVKESQAVLNRVQSRFPEYAREHGLK